MARVTKVLGITFMILTSFVNTKAQPAWITGTPSVVSAGPLSITLNYGLKQAGTVYIIVFNYENRAELSSFYVRSRALSNPSGDIVETAALKVSSSNTNKVLQVVLNVKDPDRIHTIYIVAANRIGILQSSPVRLTALTESCKPVDAGEGGVECDLNFSLNAVLNGGSGLWTLVSGPGKAVFNPDPGSPDVTVTVTLYGTYIFRWTVTDGVCSGSADITVTFYSPPVADAGRGGYACGNSFLLNARPVAGSTETGTWTMTSGSGTAVFSPDANTPNATVTVSEYGIKVFTWTVVKGPCSNSANVTVNFYMQPVADPGTGGNLCGREIYLNARPSIGTGTWTRVSGPGNAVFTPDAHTPDAKVSVSRYGSYVFRWTEVNGPCSSDASITISFFEQLSANAGNGGDECDRDFLLNAVPGLGTGTWSMVSGPGNAVFTPDASQPDARVTVSQYGSYDFAWTEVTPNCSSADVIRVIFHSPPDINAGPDLAVCSGGSIKMQASGSGSFLWSPAESISDPIIPDPVASPASTTVYTVTLTDSWGCINSDHVIVEVRVMPMADAGTDQSVDNTFETFLEAAGLNQNETGEWRILKGNVEFENKNSNITLVTGLAEGINTFVWSVTNGACPPVEDTVIITVRGLLIPTLITPNMDGKNDFFVLRGIQSLGITRLTIFNRWGVLVYKNDNYNNDWDGRDLNNSPLPEDTYYYIIEPEKRKPLNGYIIIKR